MITEEEREAHPWREDATLMQQVDVLEQVAVYLCRYSDDLTLLYITESLWRLIYEMEELLKPA